MSKQDDVLLLPQSRSPKGPTAEELKALRAIIYRKTSEPAIGDEIVQELYHDMLQWAPEELQGLKAPQAYANTAVIYRLLNWRRQFPQTDPLPVEYEGPPEEAAPSPEEILETRDQVVELLAKLPKQWVDPWLLCRYHGYTNAEAAQKLGLTVDTVKKRVLRA